MSRSDWSIAAPDFSDSRVTFVAALAWRAMTEIVRRHHVAHTFRLVQIHPGTSVRGGIELHLENTDSGLTAVLRFNLGGSVGTWEVANGSGGHLMDLLGTHPAETIDRMERAASLPPVPSGKLPASSDGVWAMRLIAVLLERKVFAPVPWRTTLGLLGWSHDIVVIGTATSSHRWTLAPRRTSTVHSVNDCRS